ncbi:WbqC family protein [Sungkyunkwania multivorans]|uniref:WbqC family protein n=1 Tax=Sungkyunkwania multivorans TaxID=1173618 RepID=A0ABW3D4V7_9FLAO
MKIAIMQPYFFPYIGYFHLLHSVDTFVFYDDVHFVKKGWIHRNNILINGTSYLFTIPCVKPSQNKLIKDIATNFSIAEKQLFLKRLEQAYKKSPYFEEFYPSLEQFIKAAEQGSIGELAAQSVMFITEYLGIERAFKFSSETHSDSRGAEKQERLIAIVKKEGATDYHNAIGGTTLYAKEDFLKENINLQFIKSNAISYAQDKKSFVPWLSIIDVLMFNSKEKTNELITSYQLI